MYVLKLENETFVKLTYAGDSGDGQFEIFDVEEVSLKYAQIFTDKKRVLSLAKDINFGADAEYVYMKKHHVVSIEKVELKTIKSLEIK